MAGIILIGGLWGSAFSSSHAQSNIQFSGQAIQSAPDGRTRQAQLFVGDNQVRLEHRRGDLDMVEIYDMKHQRLFFLVPQQKIYMQRAMPTGQVMNPMLPPKNSNPCAAMPEGQCQKLGSEKLYGRPVSKWQVTVDRQGRKLQSLHWIDDERMMSLHDVWPDGSVSELVPKGTEKFGGRMTERWQRTTTHSNGKKDVTTQWYDPELQMTVREELPGGFFREIKDIHVASQPPRLFQVPADYKLVDKGAQH